MLDTYETALVLCGMDPENSEDFDNSDKVDEILYEKYGIVDTDGFDILIKDLAKLATVGTSELTGNSYRGFAKKNEWLYKIELNND
jgi:hypothetical protein